MVDYQPSAVTREKEASHHQQELRNAAELIKSAFPGSAVKCFFVAFDGVKEASLRAKEEVA